MSQAEEQRCKCSKVNVGRCLAVLKNANEVSNWNKERETVEVREILGVFT